MTQLRPYEPAPRYEPVGHIVCSGWDDAAATLPATPVVLAVDGVVVLDWTAVIAGLTDALERRGQLVETIDLRDHLVPWDEVVRRTASFELPDDDPDFATITSARLAELIADVPQVRRPASGVRMVFGPGAAEVDYDVLWYADLAKRHAEAAITAGTALNLGQPAAAGPGTTKRLFYIDWPLLDRHRDSIAAKIDRWIDAEDPHTPASLDGGALRATITQLAGRPFRARPTFNSTAWGGHWGQRELGLNADGPNSGLGYELIGPESGVLFGALDGGPAIEVPFQLLVSMRPGEVLGERAYATFGTSFPVRFDYLDTVGGQSLSVHCHPQSDYMRRVFGWPYTQHESYYMMVAGEHSKVYLGLRGDIDVDAFHKDAHRAHHEGQAFDIERYVQTFRAEPHMLFLIPAGTPHGSGKGNLVLEVSSTPYLYSLRFYDWLRQDTDGNHRPVHIEHAFSNLDTRRSGDAVAEDLIQRPRTLRAGAGWREELLGRLPEMFYDVRRMVIDVGVTTTDDSTDTFHVLNLVDGEGIMIDTAAGDRHSMMYAETLLVPAAVGRYRLTALGDRPVRLLKAVVR